MIRGKIGELEMDPLRPRYAIFLDRDGTIIEDTGFLRRPEEVKLLPGAPDGLRLLREMGYALIVVSNQSGLARGVFTLPRMEAVRERFLAVLREAGVEPDDYFCCPHHVNGTVDAYRKDCADRKGSPGMILRAAHRHRIVLRGSWMIGDRSDDVKAGQAAGVRTIRIGRREDNPDPIKPEFYAENLLAASRIIQHANGRPRER